MPRGRPRGTIDDFWRKVDIRGSDECWPWLGTRHSRTPNSYGVASIDGVADKAHRHMQRLYLRRDIAPGLEVMHSCDHKWCVNPAHLSEGTHAQNMADAASRGILDGKLIPEGFPVPKRQRRPWGTSKGRPAARRPAQREDPFVRTRVVGEWDDAAYRRACDRLNEWRAENHLPPIDFEHPEE